MQHKPACPTATKPSEVRFPGQLLAPQEYPSAKNNSATGPLPLEGRPCPSLHDYLKTKDEIPPAHQNSRRHLAGWLLRPRVLQAALFNSLLFHLLPGRVLPGLAVEVVAAGPRQDPEDNEKDGAPDVEIATAALG